MKLTPQEIKDIAGTVAGQIPSEIPVWFTCELPPAPVKPVASIFTSDKRTQNLIEGWADDPCFDLVGDAETEKLLTDQSHDVEACRKAVKEFEEYWQARESHKLQCQMIRYFQWRTFYVRMTIETIEQNLCKS